MNFKICYLWVDKFRNFEKFGVNLSSNFKFEFDYNNKVLTKEAINNVPDNFFGNDVSDVTGIIGKNGTGKSNLLELVCKLVKGGKTSIESDFFIVIKIEDQFECHYRFKEFREINVRFPISFIEYKGDLDNLKVIYFSNVFDERTHVFDRKVSDLSANNRYPRHNWPSKKKTSDFVKQLQFIRSDSFVDSEIPIPKKVVITPKINTYNHSYVHKGLRPEFSKNQEFVSKLSSFLSDIKTEKPSKNKLYYYLLSTVVLEVVDIARDFKSSNNFAMESVDSRTKFLIEDLSSIKLSPRNRLEIANTWKDWCEGIIYDSYTQYFQDSEKNSRKYEEIENLDGIFKLLAKYEEFVEFKNIEISTEGSRNRKTEDYIIEYSQSANRLDEDFYNFMDRSTKYKLDWLGLSSGHKAYLNLFSLLRFELKSIKTTNILICIDEGDLYLHPKWQADFFYKLINLIPQFKNAKYQFILTSHSPFLVSDLPRENLVFLNKNNDEIFEITSWNNDFKTFGGNLGELYIDAFFMEGNLISRFAAGKIQDIVNKINKKMIITMDDKKVIQMIGEDLIRTQINNLLNDKNR